MGITVDFKWIGLLLLWRRYNPMLLNSNLVISSGWFRHLKVETPVGPPAVASRCLATKHSAIKYCTLYKYREIAKNLTHSEMRKRASR